MTEGTDTEIRRLDPATVERIAAGEVVERPASVVKELVENALDADADRVTVAVEQGGIEGIRVTDDGIGMSRAEVERAVEEHTTSKIRSIDDLEAGVGTLGFRGEALHAIGAVSRLTIISRPRGGDRGAELAVEGGTVTSVESAGCPTGTTVDVADLFYNVPARRKYLKQESTEFAHVNTVVANYALANPDVAISLSHDGRETFATTGQGDRRATVMSVYGREVAQSMLAIDDERMPEGPLDGITGLISHPETNRASRDYLSTFVNGRYVTASAVREAIVDAYGTQLAGDRYPFAVVDLAVDPGTVDVNVHPRKLDVRFADAERVREQIESAIEETLLAEGMLRSSAPRGRSAAEEATISPGDNADERAVSDTDADNASPERSATDGSTTSSPGTSADSPAPTEPDDSNSRIETGDRNRTTSTQSSSDRRKFTPAHDQQRLGDGDADEQRFDSLPSMRVLGQFRETYVVAETNEGLVLIDQHAADERVNYERLREAFDGETTTQALAEPVKLELTARESALFDTHDEALARLGFRVDRVDERTVSVRSIPALIAETDGPEIVRDVLVSFADGDTAATATVDAAVDGLLADLACHPSITGNISLTEGSIVGLLDRLDDCENPYACPHGRPVIVEFDDGEIESRFERDYPGHDG